MQLVSCGQRLKKNEVQMYYSLPDIKINRRRQPEKIPEWPDDWCNEQQKAKIESRSHP
jgi:hypothetical protein